MEQVTVTRLDDLDYANGVETPGAKTVEFGLEGTLYEIDLAQTNDEKLRITLADYIAKARKTTAPARARKPRKAHVSAGLAPAARKEIRAWAKANGAQLGERGRLPAEVVEAHQTGNLSLLVRFQEPANA